MYHYQGNIWGDRVDVATRHINQRQFQTHVILLVPCNKPLMKMRRCYNTDDKLV